MKIQTQIVSPEWAKDGETFLEIVADGGRPIYLGARKCNVFSQITGEIASFGRTYKVKEASAKKSARSVTPAAPVQADTQTIVDAAVAKALAAMQAQFASLNAPKVQAAAPVTNGNGKARRKAAAAF